MRYFMILLTSIIVVLTGLALIRPTNLFSSTHLPLFHNDSASTSLQIKLNYTDSQHLDNFILEPQPQTSFQTRDELACNTDLVIGSGQPEYNATLVSHGDTPAPDKYFVRVFTN